MQQLVATLDTNKKASTDKVLKVLGLNRWENGVSSISTNSVNEFLISWQNYDFAIEKFEEVCARVQKSSRAKEFFKKPFNSGYSMGEREAIVIHASIGGVNLSRTIEIRDTRAVYRGDSKRWNGKIVYGEKILKAEFSYEKNRTKYIEQIKRK